MEPDEPTLIDTLSNLLSDIVAINDRVNALRRAGAGTSIGRELASAATKLDEARHWTHDALAIATACD